ETHRAAGMRAAADRDALGIMRDVIDALERHAEPGVDELREAGLVALAAIHRTKHQLDAAARFHRYFGALAREAAGDLDVIADADAAQLAILSRFRLTRGKAPPVGEVERGIHALLVFAVVVGLADGVGIGEGVLRDEILAPQLDRIEAALIGGEIDQPLDDID